MTLKTVPHTLAERSQLRKAIDHFVANRSLIPPLSMDDLSELSGELIRQSGFDSSFKGWIMVELNNCVWRETVAAIPYDRRILLLPKCLSHSKQCRAEVDELGLLCHRCNSCSIPDLQDKANRLGMMSLVAEGFTSVIELIENRIVDTVIGVSCLDSLEKAFPLLIDHAVPGVAISLNKAGCKDTEVDFEYVDYLISLKSDKEIDLLDYDYLKSTVREWFTQEPLSTLFPTSSASDRTSAIAQKWLSGDGKRWRPYLLASTYLALTGRKEIPQEVQQAATAVECFHKASLIHDDIQDNDAMRYNKQTLHIIYGIPMAINVGDLLLGEGYRLLAQCGIPRLVQVVSEAHIALCKGQGMELQWSADPQTLTMEFVLDIFRHKTVPAFDVSLMMGLICAGGDEPLQTILHQYSQAIGIAYQLQDDLDDFDTDEPVALRPSAVLAVLCEQPAGEIFFETLLRSNDWKAFLLFPENKGRLEKALIQVRQMAEHYHREALNSLQALTHVELKRLLFRVTQRIPKH